ncbi:MAG: roadblock/LC7 domain-containing protein [Candidatus Hermodarchaeota archaeon]
MESVKLGNGIITSQIRELLENMHRRHPQILTSVLGTSEGLPMCSFSSDSQFDDMDELAAAAFAAHIYMLGQKLVQAVDKSDEQIVISKVIIYSTSYQLICLPVESETMLAVVGKISNSDFNTNFINQKPVIISTETGLPTTEFSADPTVDELHLAALTTSLSLLGTRIITDCTNSNEQLMKISIHSNTVHVICTYLEGKTSTFVCSSKESEAGFFTQIETATKNLNELLRLQKWLWDAQISHPLVTILKSVSLQLKLFCPLCGAQGLVQGQEKYSEMSHLVCPTCENTIS